jgi:excisionase family DNA binding protein
MPYKDPARQRRYLKLYMRRYRRGEVGNASKQPTLELDTYTTKEVACILHVCTRTVLRWIHAGKMRAVQINEAAGEFKIPVAEVEARVLR